MSLVDGPCDLIEVVSDSSQLKYQVVIATGVNGQKGHVGIEQNFSSISREIFTATLTDTVVQGFQLLVCQKDFFEVGAVTIFNI